MIGLLTGIYYIIAGSLDSLRWSLENWLDRRGL